MLALMHVAAPALLTRNTRTKKCPFSFPHPPATSRFFTDKPQRVCKVSSNIVSVGNISKLNWKSRTLQPVEEFLALIMEDGAD